MSERGVEVLFKKLIGACNYSFIEFDMSMAEALGCLRMVQRTLEDRVMSEVGDDDPPTDDGEGWKSGAPT